MSYLRRRGKWQKVIYMEIMASRKISENVQSSHNWLPRAGIFVDSFGLGVPTIAGMVLRKTTRQL